MDTNIQFEWGNIKCHPIVGDITESPPALLEYDVPMLGSVLGTPLYIDECSTSNSRISFARLLVQMDITRPLSRLIKIPDHHGNVIEQAVEHEWKPEYFKTCL